MNFEQLIIKNRSCRRFDQNRAVGLQTLRYLVDIARRTPSGANRQPLKYILVADAPRCARLFPHLHWAAALKDWAGPAQGERPTAYIIVLADKTVAPNPGCDHGIACQSMMLAAVERGFGGCMVGSIERDAIRADFKVPDKFDILLYGVLDQNERTFDAFSFPTLPNSLFFFVDYGSGANSKVTLSVNTPEPASVLLLGLGAAALGWRRRRGD